MFKRPLTLSLLASLIAVATSLSAATVDYEYWKPPTYTAT